MIHATVMMLAFLLAVAGLAAAFDSHNLKTDPQTYLPAPIPNLYTLHSWVGLTAVILFAMQVNCFLPFSTKYFLLLFIVVAGILCLSLPQVQLRLATSCATFSPVFWLGHICPGHGCGPHGSPGEGYLVHVSREEDISDVVLFTFNIIFQRFIQPERDRSHDRQLYGNSVNILQWWSLLSAKAI